MSVRQSEILHGPYQVSFNSVDLGGIEEAEIQIASETASTKLINGIVLKRDTARSVTVLLTLVETAGTKTALAALFPSQYTAGEGETAELAWGVSTCGAGTTPQTLILASDCDTTTDEDFSFFGAVPNLDGIEVPADGPRKFKVRMEIQGDSSGNLFQVGNAAS